MAFTLVPCDSEPVWESAPYVPGWLSVDAAPIAGLLGTAVVLALIALEFRVLAAHFARALGGVILAQALSFALALAVGTWLRRRGGNPNDVYVAAAVTGGLIGLAGLGFAVFVRPRPFSDDVAVARVHAPAAPAPAQPISLETGLVTAGVVPTLVMLFLFGGGPLLAGLLLVALVLLSYLLSPLLRFKQESLRER